MQIPVNRIAPQGDPRAYQTYAMSRRPDTLVRAACAQVGCPAYLHGWETKVDESTLLGRQQADYIRRSSGRTFTTHADGGLTVFRFEARQRCFANHQTIPERFTVLGGDWRDYSGIQRVHRNGRDWAEDFGEHQQGLADQIEKG